MSKPWGSWYHGIFWVLEAVFVTISVIWDVTEMYLLQRSLLPKRQRQHFYHTDDIWHYIQEDTTLRLKSCFVRRMCNVFCLSFLLSFYLFFLSLLYNTVAVSDYSTDDRMTDIEGAEKNHKESSFKILHSFYIHITICTFLPWPLKPVAMYMFM